MKKYWKTWLRPLIFTLGGAAAGLVYYHAFGCTTGCPITSSPYLTTAYLALVGLLLSGITRGEKGA